MSSAVSQNPAPVAAEIVSCADVAGIAAVCVSAKVGTARCAVPARVVAGGTNDRVALTIRKSCAAARGADIAARCPYHAKHTLAAQL